MKKSKIIGLLTFTFLLFGSLSAYASWGISYGSDIKSNIINVYGYSYTGTDVVADEVYARSWFYQGDTVVDHDSDLVQNGTWAQADVECFNNPGDQLYMIEGFHYAWYNNGNKDAETTVFKVY